MAIERDCNTCRHHIQGQVLGACDMCLMHPLTLSRWEPKLDSYVAAIDERHTDELCESIEKPWNQSRKESLIEATLNTLSGFLVSFGLWLFVVAPLFGIQSNPVESFWITSVFTVVSVARSYLWRRLFVNKFWRKDA